MEIDEKIRILRYIARRLLTWRFEIDELVNEAWMTQDVRKCDNKVLLWIITRRRMIDYMRNNTKYRKRYKIHMHPLWIYTDEDSIYSTEPAVEPFDRASFNLDLDSILISFNRTQKLIIKARSDGITLEIIAKAIGISVSRVSQIWHELEPILREKLLKGESG